MLLPSTGGPLLEGETSLAVNDQQVMGHTQMYCKYANLPPRCLLNGLIVTALKACGDLMGLVHLYYLVFQPGSLAGPKGDCHNPFLANP